MPLDRAAEYAIKTGQKPYHVIVTPVEAIKIYEALEAYWNHPTCIKEDFAALRERWKTIAQGA